MAEKRSIETAGRLMRDRDSAKIQGFAPSRIETVTGDYDVTGITAIRVGYPTDYSIDGGTLGTMSGVTVIAAGVTKFNFPVSTTFEVM
jgi:hypothetical protein